MRLLKALKYEKKFKYYLNEWGFKVALACLIVFLTTLQVSATVVTTNAATGVTSDTVVFHATIGGMGGTGTLWFEYGGNGFIYKSANQTISNGAVADTVSGFPIMAGLTYQYRAVVNDGVSITTGNAQSFNTPKVTTIDTTDYNFTAHFNELIEANLDPEAEAQVAVKPYTDPLGNIFWGIFFGAIFGFIWFKQEDITIPSILGILIGASIWSMMPVEWVAMGQSLLVVSLAGLVYSLIRPRS